MLTHDLDDVPCALMVRASGYAYPFTAGARVGCDDGGERCQQVVAPCVFMATPPRERFDGVRLESLRL